uniref:RNase H type-1 domain-containing protein n=1 Tax=Brassica oleracea TaxID=3712 RepID=A0A3P6FSV7_BRAOL|nr:unnamed protein product [Brassica oleracea]
MDHGQLSIASLDADGFGWIAGEHTTYGYNETSLDVNQRCIRDRSIIIWAMENMLQHSPCRARTDCKELIAMINEPQNGQDLHG